MERKGTSHQIAGLFRRYETNIRAFLKKRVFQREDVEDMVQETFLKAHKVENWEEVKNPEAYLVRVASNVARDKLRRQQKDLIEGSDDITALDVTSGGPNPEQKTEHQQDLIALEQVIAGLTPKVRQAIIFIKIMNLSYAEASKIMGITISTLENHIARGMADCRKKMLREQEAGSTSAKVIPLAGRQKPHNGGGKDE